MLEKVILLSRPLLVFPFVFLKGCGSSAETVIYLSTPEHNLSGLHTHQTSANKLTLRQREVGVERKITATATTRMRHAE